MSNGAVFELQRLAGNAAVCGLLSRSNQHREAAIKDVVSRSESDEVTVVQRCPGGCNCKDEKEEIAQRQEDEETPEPTERIVTDEDIRWLENLVENRTDPSAEAAQETETAQTLTVQGSWTSCLADKFNFAAAIAATLSAGAATVAAALVPEPTTLTKWAAAGFALAIIAGLLWAISAAIAWRNCENQQPDRNQQQIDRLQRQIDQMQHTVDELNRIRGQAPSPPRPVP